MITTRDGTTNGHVRAQSATDLLSSSTNMLNSEMRPRRAISVIYNPSSDVADRLQPIYMQTGYQDKINQSTLISPFDQSRLDHRLLVALIPEPYIDREFVPREMLNKLVTQQSVEDELSRIEYLATKIIRRTWRPATKPRILPHPSPQSGLEGYQQVFAILLFMGRAKKIWSFVKERVCDTDLPLDKVRQDGAGIFQLQRCGSTPTPLRCLKRQSDITGFVTRQWCVLAPSFGEEHIKAKKGQIMPYTDWGSKCRRGGSGEVYKAKIHPDHHSFDKDEVHDHVVAVKKLFINNRDALGHEFEVLRSLHKKKNAPTHLTSLLASYQQDDYLYLILPWAEEDLDQYWRSKHPTPPRDSVELATWLKQQSCGIAGAVAWIHRYHTTSGTSIKFDHISPTPRASPISYVAPTSSALSIRNTSPAPNSNKDQTRRHSHSPLGHHNPKTLFGRHGDIKPANILWFPSANSHGTLKVCDFGATRFSDNESASVRDKDTVPNSRPYQSPECQLPGVKISSQCDVWALGCVFLEFVVWYFGGKELLEGFEQERTDWYETSSFFYIRRDEGQSSKSAELKTSVVEMIARLQVSVTNSDLLDVLKIIQNDMLIVLGDSKRHRKSAANIARDLGQALKPVHEQVKDANETNIEGSS